MPILKKFGKSLHPSRLIGTFARMTACLVLFAWCLASGLYCLITLSIDGRLLRTKIVELIGQQTGSKLEIGPIHFDLLTGIQIFDVKLYPPDPLDPRGFLKGGAVSAKPVVSFKTLDISYDFLALFKAQANISSIKLINPQFFLEKTDGLLSIEGISRYRQEHFPAQPQTKEAQQEKSEIGNSALPFLPIHPKALFLPFSLKIESFGFDSIGFDYNETQEGKNIKNLSLKNLSFNTHLRWQGNKSELILQLNGKEHPPLIMTFKDDLEQNLTFNSNLDFTFKILDLSRLDLNFAILINHLETKQINLKDFKLATDLHLELFDNLGGIHISSLSFNCGDFFSYDFNGDVSWPHGHFNKLWLDTNQKFSLNLKHLTRFATPMLANLALDGVVELQSLVVQGEVDIQQLKNISQNPSFPYIKMRLNLDELGVKIPTKHLEASGLSGEVSLALSPSLIGEGSQLDLMVDLGLEKAFAKAHIKQMGEMESLIHELAIRMTTRATYPSKTVPIFKGNVEAKEIAARGTTIGQFEMPLYLDLDGVAFSDLSLLVLNLRAELGELLSSSLSSECRQKCKDFRLSSDFKLSSLRRLHSLALPVVTQLDLTNKFPSLLSGRSSFHVNARGSLPSLSIIDANQFLSTAQLDYQIQFDLNQFNLHYPLFDTKLSDFELNLRVEGDLADTQIRFSKKFKGLSLAYFDSNKHVNIPLKIRRFGFNLDTNHKFNGPIDLKTPWKGLSSQIEVGLHIAEFDAKPLLPETIHDFEINLDLSHLEDRSLDLKEFFARIQDFGIEAKIASKLIAEESFLTNPIPKNTSSQVALIIDHSKGQDLPFGIKTGGQLQFSTQIETHKLESASISGSIDFDRFKFALYPQENSESAPIILDEMSGKIPFKQLVDINKVNNQLQEKIPPTKKPGDSNLEEILSEYSARKEDKTLENGNQIALADYSSIRPLFKDRKPIFIKKISAANLDIENIEFDMELKQNWFALNQIFMSFLDGKIHGELQCAFDPLPQKIKVAFHLTKLDTSKLLANYPHLKKKYSNDSFGQTPYIDATIHLDYDLQENDLKGGMEINSIGKEQLKMILTFIDPNENNPAISNIKTALALGDIDWVSIPIKNGEFDFDVHISLLNAPLPVPKIRRFPIAQLLNNFIGSKPRS